jgi:hypothetical protein
MDLTQVVQFKFQDRAIGSARRTLQLRAPDGPSTGGGLLARQSVVLQAEGGDTVVCGWADLPAKRSDLRSFSTVAEQFSARKGHLVDFTQREYEALLGELEELFVQHGMEVRSNRGDTKDLSAGSGGPSLDEARGNVEVGLWIAIAVGLAIGLVGGWLVFAR